MFHSFTHSFSNSWLDTCLNSTYRLKGRLRLFFMIFSRLYLACTLWKLTLWQLIGIVNLILSHQMINATSSILSQDCLKRSLLDNSALQNIARKKYWYLDDYIAINGAIKSEIVTQLTKKWLKRDTRNINKRNLTYLHFRKWLIIQTFGWNLYCPPTTINSYDWSNRRRITLVFNCKPSQIFHRNKKLQIIGRSPQKIWHFITTW